MPANGLSSVSWNMILGLCIILWVDAATQTLLIPFPELQYSSPMAVVPMASITYS